MNNRLEYFSSAISHDALSYINHILNFCTLGMQSNNLPDSLRIIDTVHSKAKSLKNMAQSLIRYHRLNQKAVIQEIDLNELVKSVVDEIDCLNAGRDVHLSIEHLPKVQSDVELLKQVFMNLLSNCIKYRHPERILTIEIFTRTLADDNIEISIKDNGIGIEEDIKIIVFEKFVRGKSSVEGSGLGLNICRQIIQNMNGDISVVSTVGEGSTFSFSLPSSLSNLYSKGTKSMK